MIWFPLGVFALLIILGLTFIPSSRKSPGFIFSCVLSLLIAFLVSFLYSFIKNSYPLTNDTSRILMHYMVHDHLFFYSPGAALVLVCLVCLRKELSRYAAQAMALVLLCLYMGFAMLASFFYSSHSGWADPYLLFYLTGCRVFQCLVFAGLAHFIFIKSRWFFMVGAIAIILAVPFITAQVSFLFYTSKVHAATVLLAFLYGAALIIGLSYAIVVRRLES